ncbi:UNVERIFIED_CONTAM: hypothetical protein Scaly_2613000 [Sesamum calycinum]|uniref:Uncharacterized protein n=1 Tax=Sesamum calycinum TaxID=2727403 RepID=A0AAW2JBI0_9LAMI
MPMGYQPLKFQQFDGKGNPKRHVAHFIETCNKTGTYGQGYTIARQGKISLEEDSAATNVITIESGHVDGNKDSCNAMHGDNITSNEVTLFEKENSSYADDCMSTITFTDEDLLLGSKPHNRPLFVAGYVREQKVNRILIDGGSAVNIFSLRILKELGIPIDELSNSRLMIQGFNQGGQRAVGIILIIVKKVFGDNKPFTEAESHFVDAKCYIEHAKNGKEVLPSKEPKSCNNQNTRKTPTQGFVPSTQEEEGRHETLAIDKKEFDPKAFKLLIKVGYDSKEKLSLGKLPPEASSKKLHGLNATQMMLKEKGHAIQDSRVGLDFTPSKLVCIAIKKVNNNYISDGFSSTENHKRKENLREYDFNRLGPHRKALHGIANRQSDSEVEEEEDAKNAPAELEEGIKATINELKEVNLGDIEDP